MNGQSKKSATNQKQMKHKMLLRAWLKIAVSVAVQNNYKTSNTKAGIVKNKFYICRLKKPQTSSNGVSEKQENY